RRQPIGSRSLRINSRTHHDKINASKRIQSQTTAECVVPIQAIRQSAAATSAKMADWQVPGGQRHEEREEHDVVMDAAAYEHRYVVVVAGGSGTRLWPASRRELPKQMQAFISDRTLIAETVERLRSGFVPTDHIYISTTQNYADRMRRLLPDLPVDN